MLSPSRRVRTRLGLLAALSFVLPCAAAAAADAPTASTATAAPAVSKAIDTPCSGIHLISLSNYIAFPAADPKANPASIRSGPSVDDPAIAGMPPEDPKDRLRPSAEFDVVGSHGAWLLVRNVRRPGSGEIAFAGPGWIWGGIAHGTPASPLRTAPSESAPVLEKVPQPGPEPPAVLGSILGCKGTWIHAIVLGGSSLSEEGWFDSICPVRNAFCEPGTHAAEAALAAVYNALDRDVSPTNCGGISDDRIDPPEELPVRADYAISTVHLASGAVVYLATGRHCTDEAPTTYHDFRAYVKSADGTYKLAYQGIAEWSNIFGSDGSLFAATTDRSGMRSGERYRFDGSSYRHMKHEAVYLPTGEVEHDPIPLHFATGASSITVTGHPSAFPDEYTLYATAGQTMSIDAHAIAGKINGAVISCGKGCEVEDSPQRTWSGRLPKTGEYFLSVTKPDVSRATYAMMVTIH